jgi:hypothetical protein
MPAIRLSGGSGPLLRSSNRSSTADGWGPSARRRGGRSVITSEPTPAGHPAASAPGSGGRATSPDAPVTTLRGAGVDVDPRRARLLVIGASVVVLLGLQPARARCPGHRHRHRLPGPPGRERIQRRRLLVPRDLHLRRPSFRGGHSRNCALPLRERRPGRDRPERPGSAVNSRRGRRPACLVESVHRTGDPVRHRPRRGGRARAHGQTDPGPPISRRAVDPSPAGQKTGPELHFRPSVERGSLAHGQPRSGRRR